VSNVRDARRHSFFVVDNEVMHHYARHIGGSGLAVYCCLLMHANHETGSCILRTKTIAERSGMSQSTVKRSLHLLAAADSETDASGNPISPTLSRAGLPPLISITGRFGEGGHRISSEYTILPVAKDYAPDEPRGVNLTPPAVNLDPPWVQSDTTVGSSWHRNNQTDSNQTQKNKTSPLTPQWGEAAEDGLSTATEPKVRPLDERFERWWTVYPKKVGKQAARREWEKIKPSEALTAEMIAAVEAQARSHDWTRERGRYIPNPSTWLHQGRWEDQPEVELPEPEPVEQGPVELTADKVYRIARSRLRFSAREHLSNTAHPMTEAQITRIKAGEVVMDVLTPEQQRLVKEGYDRALNLEVADVMQNGIK
jgi:hypothetical protein